VHFLLRLLITALGFATAAYLVPGFYIQGVATLFLSAFLLGVANAIVRPILFVLTLPITILSLGIFILVLNAAMIGLVAWILPGFSISGIWSALGGWLIITIVSWIASQVFKKS
jgi:putative membrane protein